MRRGVLLVTVLAATLLPRTASAATAQTFTVTNANGIGAGSLDQAIADANTNGNPSVIDKIDFAIPGNGPFTINPPNELPDILEPVIIDGYTQGDATPGTPADDARPNDEAGPSTNAIIKIAISMLNSNGDFGLVVDARDVTVRGLDFHDARLGVELDHTSGAHIEGNFFGTDPTGTTASNNGSIGVEPNVAGAVIGGPDPADRNLISGNAGTGVDFPGPGARNVTIENNLIGTKPDGTTALGNGIDGIDIRESSNANILVTRNVIAKNINNGVTIQGGGSGTRVLSNAIFLNGGFGIDIDDDGVTPNDHKDPDAGTNHLQNYPVIASAHASGGTITVRGSLDSRPRHKYLIQFFGNDQAGENGQRLLAQKTLKTKRSGTRPFAVSLSNATAPAYVTATATDLRTHDTSEFSVPVLIS